MLKPEEKLEWVTPKISLMEAEETDGDCKGLCFINENKSTEPEFGPS